MDINKNYYEDYDKHSLKIYMFVKGMTGQEKVAENILTRVFLTYRNIVDRFEEFSGKQRDVNVLSHLFISAKNECFDYFRRMNASTPTALGITEKQFEAGVVKEVSKYYDIKHKNLFQKIKELLIKPIARKQPTQTSTY